MIRRRGPIELGRRHGRLAPLFAAPLFALYTAVLLLLQAAPVPWVIGCAVGAAVLGAASSRGWVEVTSESVEIASHVPGRSVPVIPTSEIEGVTTVYTGPVIAPGLVLSDRTVVRVDALGANTVIVPPRSTQVLASEMAAVIGVEVVASEGLDVRRLSRWRQAGLIVGALGGAIGLLLGAAWLRGEQRFPLVATEGRFESPAEVAFEGGETHGIWGGPGMESITVIAPDGTETPVQRLPWDAIYERRTPVSGPWIGRVTVEQTGLHRITVVESETTDVSGMEDLAEPLALSFELAPLADVPRFSVGQDPLIRQRRRTVELLIGAAVALTLGPALGVVLWSRGPEPPTPLRRRSRW